MREDRHWGKFDNAASGKTLTVNSMRTLILSFAVMNLLHCNATADESAIEMGRLYAEANCAKCHAIGESGEGIHPEAPNFRKLSQFYPVEVLEEAFAEGIVTGHPDMPEFEIDPVKINELLVYINSVQAKVVD